MQKLPGWLPWVIGLILALILVRFVAGFALRIVVLAVLAVVVYSFWRSTGRRG